VNITGSWRFFFGFQEADPGNRFGNKIELGLSRNPAEKSSRGKFQKFIEICARGECVERPKLFSACGSL